MSNECKHGLPAFAYCQSCCRDISAEASNNGWIRVEDELPEDGALVLAYGRFNGETYGLGELMIAAGTWSGPFGEYTASISMVADAYFAELVDVTHWMPIPAPPKDKT